MLNDDSPSRCRCCYRPPATVRGDLLLFRQRYVSTVREKDLLFEAWIVLDPIYPQRTR